MKSKSLASILFASLIALGSTPAHGQAGSLVRKGASLVRKLFQKSASESGQAVSKKVKPQEMVKSAPKHSIVQKTAKQTGELALRKIRGELGNQGVELAKSLSPSQVRKFSSMASSLALSPYKGQWLELLKSYPSRCLSFLWKHKGKIAVASGVGFVFLHPNEFLETTETVITSTVESTTKHMGKPLVENTVEQIAAPVANKLANDAVNHISWQALSVGVGAIGFVIFGMWCYRRR